MIEMDDQEAPIAETEEQSAFREMVHRNSEESEVSDGSKIRQYALDRMDNFWVSGVRVLVQYSGNLSMALDCFLLALGKGEMIPVPPEMRSGPNPTDKIQTAAEIALKHFRDRDKRAAVTKCIKMFQDSLGIGPMPGQRKDEGRSQMGRARGQQLKNEH